MKKVFILLAITLNSLEAGKIANLVLHEPRSPFHKSCEEFNVKLIIDLIKHYCEKKSRLRLFLNEQNANGQTALDILLTSKQLDTEKIYEIVEILIENNAAISSKKVIKNFLMNYPSKELEDLLSNTPILKNEEILFDYSSSDDDNKSLVDDLDSTPSISQDEEDGDNNDDRGIQLRRNLLHYLD